MGSTCPRQPPYMAYMAYPMDPYVYLLALRIHNIKHHTYHTCNTRWSPYVRFMILLCPLCDYMHTCHTTTYHIPCRAIAYHTLWDPYVHCMSLCLHSMSTIPHVTHISTLWLYAYIPYHTIHSAHDIPFGIHMST